MVKEPASFQGYPALSRSLRRDLRFHCLPRLKHVKTGKLATAPSTTAARKQVDVVITGLLRSAATLRITVFLLMGRQGEAAAASKLVSSFPSNLAAQSPSRILEAGKSPTWLSSVVDGLGLLARAESCVSFPVTGKVHSACRTSPNVRSPKAEAWKPVVHGQPPELLDCVPRDMPGALGLCSITMEALGQPVLE
ncbi:uncharacterized protein LOC144107173 isoform X3 [Amblyomma americanum]